MHLHNGTGNSPSPGRPTPGVVKQDQSSGGSADTTKTRSGPQRVRMSDGERPIGAAKGKQTSSLVPPPPGQGRTPWAEVAFWIPPPPGRGMPAAVRMPVCQGREANRRRHRLPEPTTKALCQTPPPSFFSLSNSLGAGGGGWAATQSLRGAAGATSLCSEMRTRRKNSRRMSATTSRGAAWGPASCTCPVKSQSTVGAKVQVTALTKMRASTYTRAHCQYHRRGVDSSAYPNIVRGRTELTGDAWNTKLYRNAV